MVPSPNSTVGTHLQIPESRQRVTKVSSRTCTYYRVENLVG